MLISPAYAQDAGGGGGFDIGFLLPMVLIFGVFYMLLIRPQQKKAKQHRELLEALRRGDRIITNGGLIGLIIKVVDANELIVEIADGVRVRVARSMVSTVIAKTEPSRDDDDGDDGDDEEERPRSRKRRRRRREAPDDDE
ncbi:MAG: preprotein translocase subunit YajC [Proteobacteria bacterium]|nr:preprotein translocase subunit YajC [Pseudomonadota bacterium]MCH8092851.1 preprotein translocase subunit YajC [Pseudomonadota bacterium]MCH8096094.1 preprotein translocase subunit YajC [Pseudomonadota bacterium]